LHNKLTSKRKLTTVNTQPTYINLITLAKLFVWLIPGIHYHQANYQDSNFTIAVLGVQTL